MNALVLDYLVVEGFADAAISFAKETGQPADIDQSLIQERMDIRDAVEEGRVEEAVRRVNELDPEVCFLITSSRSLLTETGCHPNDSNIMHHA
jgi:hypothetical protein